ncbi:MAG: hypothetical protein LIP08_10465 [Bacteroides sp.]|nr:hypothetical protein [Bacteroides sp.]
MKKLIYILCICAALYGLTSCADSMNAPVLTEEEYPRILGRWPERNYETGELGTFSTLVDQPLTIDMQFTPSEFCTGVWYLDGEEVERGTTFEFVSSEPVTHYLKLIVTTSTYETYREAYIIVTE